MEQFHFLEKHPFFKRKFEWRDSIFFYYENINCFHAQIFVPKNADFDFKWNFYQIDDTSSIYCRTEDVPKWFQDLIEKAAEMVFYRDKIRRITRGKNNDFYKK